MFNSLLNAVGVDSLILDIFIILGVVVAGALIVYFLWEAVSAIVNKNKKDESNVPVLEKPKAKKAQESSAQMVEDFSLDAKPEEVVLIEEEKLADVDEVKAEEEKAEVQEAISQEDKENAERRAYLEARRQELIRRMQAEVAEEVEEVEDDDEVEEVSEVPVEEQAVVEEQAAQEITEEAVEESATETVADVEEIEEVEETQPVEAEVTEDVVETEAVETVEEVSNDEPEVDALAEERRALEEEKAKYTALLEELAAAKKALQEQAVQPAPVVVSQDASIPVEYSLEELKEKLAIAEERLRTTEKEFKQCKKEYIPLRRVWSTYEKDSKKLRRKAALVAKQKVLLYGVNNYADIDEEKARNLQKIWIFSMVSNFLFNIVKRL